MRPRTMANVVVAVMFFGAAASAAHGQLREATTTPATVAAVAFEITTGFIQVPESREPADAPSRAIDLAVVVIRRAGAPPPREAHVVLAGGPGESGVNVVMGLLRQGNPDLWALFDGDIIGIDQRGTGRSRPNLETAARYDLPLDQPGSIDAWLPRMQAVSKHVAEQFRSRGVRLEAYNTQESANDVADVLRGLGYGHATLWGRSYGSHLALAVLARHPSLATRLVLVSPEGPDHTWKSPAGVERIIDELVTRGADDLKTNLQAVLRALAERPVRVPTKDPSTGAEATIVLGAFDVSWIVSQALADSRLLATLPKALRDMAQGHFEQIAPVALLRRSRTGVQSAMKQMMDLSSGASEERGRQIQHEAASALLGNAINFPGMFLRDAWAPVNDLGGTFRRAVSSSVPVLMLVGDLDPRTPVMNAREIAGTLPRAQTVVVRNATHDFDVFGSPTIRNVIARFLRGDSVEGTIALPPLVFQ